LFIFPFFRLSEVTEKACMASSTSLVAVVTETSLLDRALEIPDGATILEVRGDLNQNISPSWLRDRFSGKLLYSLPGHCQPGEAMGPLTSRQQALIQAARAYDLVQLDADWDLCDVLAAIAAEKRLICWKGPAGDMAYLRSVFQRISSVPARLYSMIIEGSGVQDGVEPLLLLKELGRSDLTAICEGQSGFWTRILAPHFGAPLAVGTLDHGPIGNSGEPSIQQLLEDYGFPELHPVCEIYGIVGNCVFQSLSPRLHNAGYRSLHYPALFLPFHVGTFEDFWQAVIQASVLGPLGLEIKGLTIASPHKEAAFAAAMSRSPIACRAAASNIVLRRNNLWEAHTTDPESVAAIAGNGHKPAEPLKAAVIGCGGAGRAIAAALQQAGAHVTLVNRGRERGELAVRLLGLPFIPLSDFEPTAFSLLVNATPVGRDEECVPFEIDAVPTGATVVDLAYGPRPTPLAAGIAARGGTVIGGYDVLLNQVRKQFLLMTGREMPARIGRETATLQYFVPRMAEQGNYKMETRC
jgi:3-dehydroquinate dehydratase / shikimate dehydrogenase